MEKETNEGKSKCCKAEVEYEGGGYVDTEVAPVVSCCTKCGKVNPKVIRKVGRPNKVLF